MGIAILIVACLLLLGWWLLWEFLDQRLFGSTTHGTGYVPDAPDSRDFIYRIPEGASPAAFPDHFDLRDTGFLSPVYDQGPLGSCVANATCAALAFLERQVGLTGSALYEYSRLHLYYFARLLEGSVRQDSGCQIRDAFKVASKTGVVPETAWAYDIKKFKTRPPVGLLKGDRKVVTYHRVANSLDEFKSALFVEKVPVVIGISVYESFESQTVAKNGMVPLPNVRTEQFLGGHAILVVGYDVRPGRNYLICRNSWGTGWGDGGYFYLPVAYMLDQNLASDFWVARLVA